MKFITKLLNRFGWRNDSQQWEDGYNYASLTLLMSRGASYDELEAQSLGAFDTDPFDDGVREALEDWRLSTVRTAPQALTDALDARRWQFLRSADSVVTLRIHNSRNDQRDAVIDAAIEAAHGITAEKK